MPSIEVPLISPRAVTIPLISSLFGEENRQDHGVSPEPVQAQVEAPDGHARMLTAGPPECEMSSHAFWEEKSMIRLVKRAAFAAALVVPLAATAQVLEVATDASPVGLDPHVATAFSTSLVNGNIYEGLTSVEIGRAHV